MKKNAFTLIEMLVVIAIIGVLAALLSGPLMGAKKNAQVTACLNNLKQIGTAMTMYRDSGVEDGTTLGGGAAVNDAPKAAQYLTGIAISDKVPTKIFVCPVLGAVPGTGDAANMLDGQNATANQDTAYIWTTVPRASNHPARVVCGDIAAGADYTENHGDSAATDKNGGNILKADNSAEQFNGNAAVPADLNGSSGIWYAAADTGAATSDNKSGALGGFQ